MPNHQQAHLNRIFQALADPTRRAIVERLSAGPAPVSELAQPFSMALPSFSQHLGVLEGCGLVKSRKSGRVRTYQLEPKQLRVVTHWLDAQRVTWERRLDQLDDYLKTVKEQEP
jgi:DNA-binding transcriptional ArsR family regulator